MFKRELNFLVILTLILAMLAACEKVTENDNDDDDEQEDPADYTWDTSTVVQVTLNGSSISVVPSVATVSGSKLTITSAGTYNITGSLSDGQIIVNSEGDGNVRLILDGATINCSSSAPIYIKDAAKAIIILKENTKNYLTDGTSYVTTDGEPNGALFSNSYLTFYGDGSLTVTANYNDGISTDDGLIIKSGTISVTAADDGIRGKDYVIIEDGNITINAIGDGVKSDNDTDTSKGYISVDYGTFNITSSGDAFDAMTELAINDGIFNLTSGGGSAGTFTINSADDAIHSNTDVTINDGAFAISTKNDAIHAETSVTINGGTINVSKSFEAIESASITVNKGNVILVATNDGFNATKGNGGENNDGSILTLNGGYIVVNVSAGDGLDSNGNIVMTGGTVIVHGPQSSPEVAFDFNGTFTISGGLLIAGGPNSGNMIEVPGTSSAQYCVKATGTSGLSVSTLFHMQNESGNDIVTFKPVRNTYYVVVSSSALTNGSTYQIYKGGTSTGTNTDGLYTGGTYSGGTLKKSFTISSKITSITF